MSGKGFVAVSDDASEAAEKENRPKLADCADTAVSNADGSQAGESATPMVGSADEKGSDDNQSTVSDAEGSGGEPKPKERTYSQTDVDALKSRIENLEKQRSAEADRLSQVQDALQKAKKDLDQAMKIPSLLNSSIAAIYKRLGDFKPSETFPVVWELADLQLRVGEMAAIRREHDEIKKQLELEKAENLKVLQTNNEWSQRYEEIAKRNEEVEKSKSELQRKNESLESDAQTLSAEIGEQKKISDRLLGKAIPQCLIGRDWFLKVKDELLAALRDDPLFDAAMLVWASLSEFAVFERMPETTSIEADKLGKQLSDIGYVVANYARLKHGTEDAVIQMLKKFMESLNKSSLVNGKEFVLKVPTIGEEVNTDEMKSPKSVMTVNKVVNWCIKKGGCVYSKAVVE